MRKAAQIQEIYRMTDKTDEAALRSFIREYEDDPRAGIRKLVDGAGKALERIGQERERLEQMRSYERDCVQKGYTYICGIDEAGRGPLAGPVVAGAVILPQDCEIFGLNDSKKLSEKRREELYEEILQADYEAMCEAIGQLKVMPQILLNDAVTIPQVRIPQISIIHGDARSVSIAAASIIAKVTRDRMMVEYDSLFPEYGFAEHKGYGTAAHYAALKKHGPCMIHRKSFLKNLDEH